MCNQTTGQDYAFMARALFLARKGIYTSKPNPRVGCILVKNNAIIAEGWHKQAGQEHAEAEALKCTENAQDATAYVTLEPCSHYGKTAPCATALIKAGVARVVIAMQDPNPLVAGKGISLLEQAGISVSCGTLETQARQLNKGFITRMISGKPYVTSKLAMSLDARTAMASGESKWITSAEARQDVQKLRAASCAVLTGIDTVLADDPRMNVRMDNVDVKQPICVILDSSLRMSVTANLLALEGRVIILTSSTERQKIDSLQQAGAKVYYLELDANKRLDLQKVLIFLGQQEINNVLIEAGSVLNGAMMQQGLIDECIVYMAPSILGDSGRGLFTMPNVSKITDKIQLQLIDMCKIGMDIRLHYKVQK